MELNALLLPNKVIGFCFVLLSSVGTVLSQGFDWEYSNRLPFEVPTMFIGGFVGGIQYYHTGQINQIEKQILCVEYSEGKGFGIRSGLVGEYWLDGEVAINGKVGFENMIADFRQKSTPVPIDDNNILQSEYSLYAVLPSISVGAFVKKRMFDSFLWFGCGVDFRGIISKKVESSETIISPEGRVFDDGLQKRIFLDDLTSLRTLTVYPALYIGYDAQLSKGLYVSPTIKAGIPLLNNSDVANWKVWLYSLEVSILYGL